MKKIFFITGASGVGKTSLVSFLKDKYQNKEDWAFLHFDSIGVPSQEEMMQKYGSVENWQKEKTYEWITKMVKEYSDKEAIIFEGQVNLQFIKDGFLKHNFSHYKIILLDCNENTMAQRLATYRNQPELLTTGMKNWLVYLRHQAHSLGIVIIDTSNSTKDEVTKSFEKILENYLNKIKNSFVTELK